jgi:hypothetical protein
VCRDLAVRRFDEGIAPRWRRVALDVQSIR